MPSATVVVYDDSGDERRVLMAIHKDHGRWLFPGGAVDPGERPADAAVREVWEETGLEVEITALMGVFGGGPDHRVTYPNGDVVDYITSLFEARVVGGQLQADDQELGELRWVTWDEAHQLPVMPWLADVFAVLAQGMTYQPVTWRPGVVSSVAIVAGVLLVVSVMADVFNTLVTTHTSQGSWWLTRQVYTRTWQLVRSMSRRIKKDSRREQLLAAFPPMGVFLMLAAWVTQQVVGFGLIWWGVGGVAGADSLWESIYYSGIAYFTVGFGEVVPVDVIPRVGILVEAFIGLVSTALVIGYLPALYGAYSSRESQLLMLDDGSEERISPTSLVIAHSPNADADHLMEYFREWEKWTAQVMETHTTFPMLTLFRSQNEGQHWVTALGVVTDAALHLELMEDGHGKAGYWLIRRSTRLLSQLTAGRDLSDYHEWQDLQSGDNAQFTELYDRLREHGFKMRPYDEALAHSQDLRRRYAAQLEYLIDFLQAPRGFWGHSIGHVRVGQGSGGSPMASVDRLDRQGEDPSADS